MNTRLRLELELAALQENKHIALHPFSLQLEQMGRPLVAQMRQAEAPFVAEEQRLRDAIVAERDRCVWVIVARTRYNKGEGKWLSAYTTEADAVANVPRGSNDYAYEIVSLPVNRSKAENTLEDGPPSR